MAGRRVPLRADVHPVNVEDTFPRPAFSICPSSHMKKSINAVVWDGSEQECSELFANRSLADFMRTSGLSPVHMIEDLNTTREYRENASTDVFTTYYGTWKTAVNYVSGGVCATLQPQSASVRYLRLQRHHDFENHWKGSAVYSYDVIVQGNTEFWGAPVLNQAEFTLTNESTRQEMVVTIDREVTPNLRRAPCEKDPSYNQVACERRCHFAWLSCSLEERDTGGKALCMATYAPTYMESSLDNPFSRFLFDVNTSASAVKQCPCPRPRPCVRDRFSFFVRPSVWSSGEQFMQLQVIPGEVRRTQETIATYSGYDLLADVGGYLGLLLGSSLLSVLGRLLALAARG